MIQFTSLDEKVKIEKITMFRNYDIPTLENSILPNKTGFFLYVVGGVGSGKSSLVFSLLKNQYKQKFNNVYLFSPSSHTIKGIPIPSNKLKTSIKELPEVVDKITSEYKKGLSDGKVYSSLIILDDMIADIKKADIFMKRLVLNRAHSNISLIVISQKYRELPLIYRTNSSHIVFFKTNNLKEIQAIREETDLFKNKKSFYDAVSHSFKDQHSFLYFDLTRKKLFDGFDNEIQET